MTSTPIQQTSTPIRQSYKEPLPLSSDFFNNSNGLVYTISSDWSSNQNYNGVRPPQHQLIYNESQPNYSELPNPTVNNYNIIKINSLREPFAIEQLVNQYGSNTVPRLGTTLGTFR